MAYADFVTAMMSLFIVLWLLNMSKPVREAIAGYFKDPSGTAAKLGSTMEGKGEGVVKPKEDMQKLKAELEKAISQMPNFDKLKNQIEITVTLEGLRIEMLESAKGTFFDRAGARLRRSNAAQAQDPFDPSNRRISLIVQCLDSRDMQEGKAEQEVGRVQSAEKPQ